MRVFATFASEMSVTFFGNFIDAQKPIERMAMQCQTQGGSRSIDSVAFWNHIIGKLLEIIFSAPGEFDPDV